MAWDGEEYQQRFDALAALGHDVHGEADFIMGLSVHSILDAGCGTGRVAIELARRGLEVVGADKDTSMIAGARKRAPDLEWREGDVALLELGRVFDAVVMAGNVPLFTPPGTVGALVAGCARHLAPNGVLVTGFQLDRGYAITDFDEDARRSGLVLAERYATWDRDAFPGDGSYAVSVHRRPPAG